MKLNVSERGRAAPAEKAMAVRAGALRFGAGGPEAAPEEERVRAPVKYEPTGSRKFADVRLSSLPREAFSKLCRSRGDEALANSEFGTRSETPYVVSYSFGIGARGKSAPGQMRPGPFPGQRASVAAAHWDNARSVRG